MKTFILLILIIDNSGNAHIERVNNIKYKDKLHCIADKAIMSGNSIIPSDDRTTNSITYFLFK